MMKLLKKWLYKNNICDNIISVLTNMKGNRMSKASGYKYKYTNLSVDEIPCKSVSDMAALLNCNTWDVYYAIQHNKTTLKGHQLAYDIKPGDWRPRKDSKKIAVPVKKKAFNNLAFLKGQKEAAGRRAVPVKCITTGETFNSIGAVAKQLGINMWTMSLKMEKAGKFIDKEGKTYIRLKPMQQRTNRDYGNQRPDISRELIRHNKTEKTNNVVNMPVIQTVNKETTVIESLKHSTVELINCKKYNEASTLLTVIASLDK